jgi:integrase
MVVSAGSGTARRPQSVEAFDAIHPTRMNVDDWIADLSRRMGPTSVRHCYTLLRGPIRRAVKDRVIPDPLIDIVLPAKPKIRKSFDDVLTRGEVAAVAEAVEDSRPPYARLKTNGRYPGVDPYGVPARSSLE